MMGALPLGRRGWLRTCGSLPPEGSIRSGSRVRRTKAPLSQHDKRLGYGQWADDEISDLPEQVVDPTDLRPSPLDEGIT